MSKLHRPHTINVNTYLIPFAELIKKYPILNGFLVSSRPKVKFDFGDEETLRTLNYYMLKAVTGLEISVPKGFLIPAVGIHLAYCDIIASRTSSDIPILEIGTGASAIMSMVLAKKYGRLVVATELNPQSFQSAKQNITNNNLSNRISLIRSQGEIIKGLIDNKDNFSALICYPPIYPSKDKMKVQKKKGWKGVYSELIGGETGLDFVFRLINEALDSSIVNINLISVMLMNLTQVERIINHFPQILQNYEIFELIAGTRKRYILAIKF